MNKDNKQKSNAGSLIIILVISPLTLFDIGFELSVLSVSGIALIFPILS